MKTFKHLGKMGDTLFALPTIRELGGGILYLPEWTNDNCYGLFSTMKGLLLQQPCIVDVKEYPSGLNYHDKVTSYHIDYDLDDARYQPLKGRIHVIKRYMDAFGVNYENWKEPWLVVNGDPIQKIPYSLINLTPRFRENSRIDWKRVYKSIEGDVFFVGTDDEHFTFCREVGDIMRLHVSNVLDLAILIRDCDRLYCNQSLCLAIAQGLGKEYHCAFKPQKTNCKLYTPNEYELL